MVQKKKPVCKNCSKLAFHDYYLCVEERVTQLNDFHLPGIEDITCEHFDERKESFWKYEGGEF